MSMSLTPRILPGTLHPANKTACDWGWQGFLAYGCQNYVVILDPKTVQVIQTVHYHSAPICQIKWKQENYYHDIHSSYTLQLAAGNTSGHVMILDLRQGTILNDFVETNRVPLCMEWLKGHDVSHDLLLVLYQPNTLILWNANTSIKLWKKNFQDTIVSVAIDPFNNSNMTVMSTDWIMLITDLTVTQPPSEKGRKFYMSTSTLPPSSSSSNLASNGTSAKSASSKSTFQKVKSWADDLRGRQEEELDSVCDCIQIVYLPSNRNHVLLLFPREILILDIEIGQALGSFSIESTSPSFYSVIPCRQRDILFLLHDNGSISMRAVRSPDRVPYKSNDDPDQMLASRISLDIIYDMKCHSDVFRLSRASRVMNFGLNPVSECETAILLADGRVLLWVLAPPSGINSFCKEPSVRTPLAGLQETVKSLVDVNHYTLSNIVPSLLTFGNNKEKQNYYKPKFMLDGVFEGVALNPICLKMCPPMTTKNFTTYKPLLAVGCGSGVLQIFNASKGYLVKYFSMSCHNIKGLEWVHLTSLLVYFNGSSSSNKSEMVHVDVTSGLVTTLPSSRGLKESTVASLKVSHLKQYFLVLFKNHSAELWDAINLCQLREFPTNFPRITAFEWSPTSYGSKLGKKKAKAMIPEDPTSTSTTSVASNSLLDESTSNVLENTTADDTKKPPSKSKEHLVFTDNDGTVYHYVVEGTSLKDGSKVPPETGMGVVSCITWKTDMLVLGDVDGNLNLWDLKAKVSRVFPTHRGPVKRMKFAPGKGNMRMLVLYNDGVEVWDTAEAKVLGSVKTSRDQLSVIDSDWLSSSLPMLLPSDGSVRILDASMKSANSPISEKDLSENIFNPRLCDEQSSLKLKHILQHQPWREKYNCEHFSDERTERAVQDMLQIISSDVAERLYNCPLGTAERCLYTSQIYGDESDWMFWSVALYYLEYEKSKQTCAQHQPKPVSQSQSSNGLSRLSSSNSLDNFLSDSDIDEGSTEDSVIKTCTCVKSSLDANFDILCDNQFYKKLQLYRIALHDSHRSTYEHTRLCAEKLILIGETDRAVQVLLEGEPTDSGYYSDALRACLIATVRSSGASQSTIKLVATNLIASGKLAEGVELLCLVDKGTDACRYLQTYGNWELATWLAKVQLNHRDCSEVVTRWCDQLSNHNKKVHAILVLLSFGKFYKVLEIMFSIGQIDRAALFLEACIEFGVMSLDDEERCNLFENIFLDYARLQYKLKHKESAEFYCNKAGGRGKKLMADYESGVTLL